MEKQFVNHEIALKFKELDFNEPCLGAYMGNKLVILGDSPLELSIKAREINNYIKAPLWQQAIQWFIDKHNIWIGVDTSLIRFYNDSHELLPRKFQFVIEDLNDNDSNYLYHSADEDMFFDNPIEANTQAILKMIKIISNKQKIL